MLNAVKAYMKKPQTMIGIITAIMFQIIFSVIWMTAYQGVNDRADQLQVALVVEDESAQAQEIAAQLSSSLPFQVKEGMTLEDAQARLDAREVQMVIDIPQGFTSQLSTPGGQAVISYTINEANPVTVKSIMSNAAASITATVNAQASTASVMAQLVESGASPDQARQVAQTSVHKVGSELNSIHPVQGMNNQMVPMMLVLASYVGVMIMGLNVQMSTGMLGNAFTWYEKFGARIMINVVSCLLIALIGSTLVVMLGGQAEQGFLKLWMFQALFVGTFMFFAQLFLIVFGSAGMLFNIIVLSLQLVSSGAMVPRELLSPFYQTIGEWLPASYAVQGITAIQLGGMGASKASWMLLLILLISLLIGCTASALRGAKARAATAPAMNSSV